MEKIYVVSWELMSDLPLIIVDQDTLPEPLQQAGILKLYSNNIYESICTL